MLLNHKSQRKSIQQSNLNSIRSIDCVRPIQKQMIRASLAQKAGQCRLTRILMICFSYNKNLETNLLPTAKIKLEMIWMKKNCNYAAFPLIAMNFKSPKMNGANCTECPLKIFEILMIHQK